MDQSRTKGRAGLVRHPPRSRPKASRFPLPPLASPHCPTSIDAQFSLIITNRSTLQLKKKKKQLNFENQVKIFQGNFCS